jgi:hypothetical protein
MIPPYIGDSSAMNLPQEESCTVCQNDFYLINSYCAYGENPDPFANKYQCGM